MATEIKHNQQMYGTWFVRLVPTLASPGEVVKTDENTLIAIDRQGQGNNSVVFDGDFVRVRVTKWRKLGNTDIADASLGWLLIDEVQQALGREWMAGSVNNTGGGAAMAGFAWPALPWWAYALVGLILWRKFK